MPLQPGTTLGQYEIVSALGAGGMGEVYRATDTKLGREVAIKLLLDEVSSDSERVARFAREARVLGSLNHANIATLYGFFSATPLRADVGGRPLEGPQAETSFLVMELVEGDTLADRIERRSILAEEAIALFIQMAEGLEAAHESGVIHRDLKPANIKITDDGTLKILDFGLAKAMDVEPEAADASLSQSPTLTLAATQRGQILGTAAYMAPEQARGKVVDKRADVWAFGCCLYESLTRNRPFDGEDGATVLARVVEREPDWDPLEGEAPQPLADLVRRCLVKDPRSRLRDIGDARLELIRIREGASDTTRATTVPGSYPRWAWLAGGLLLGAVLAAIGLWSLDRSEGAGAAKPVRRYEISLRDLSPMLEFEGGAVALSPDGSTLALTAGAGPGARVVLRSMDSLELIPVPETEWGWYKTFSPDGQWLILQSTVSGYWRIPVAGGRPLPILGSAEYSYGGSLGADDVLVHNAGPLGGLVQVPAGGGELRTVTSLNTERGESRHAFPQVLPGGRGVLFSVLREPGDEWDVAVLSNETGEVRTLVEGGLYGRYVPTGHLVYGAEEALFAVPMDLSTLRTTGRPVQVLDDLLMFPFHGTACFTFSDEGTLVYVPSDSVRARDSRLSWVDRNGASNPFPLEPAGFRAVTLSPDGRRLAYLVFETAGENVVVLDLVAGRRTQLTEGANQTPRWSQDGRDILFSKLEPAGDWNMYRRPANGGAPAVPVQPGRGEQTPGSFSPGGVLAYTSLMPAERTLLDIWTLAPGTADPVPFLTTPASEGHPRFSPDGRWIAYEVSARGATEIFVRPYPPGPTEQQWLISAGSGRAPVWSRTTPELFYVQGEGSFMAVSYEVKEDQFVAEAPQLLFEHAVLYTGFPLSVFDVTPDGERFLVIDAPDVSRSRVVVVENWFEELQRRVPVG